MASLELTLGMLLAVLASGYLVRILPVALPLPVVQIALGGVIAGVFHQGVRLDPQVFFLLFLPPLLFLDGWRIPKDGLLRDSATILQLALGLVVFTVLGAGYFLHWMIPAMPLAVAFALAAIVSPTDPVAVSSLAARVPIPSRLMHILEGESLLNDASGLVCFQFAVAAAATGAFALESAAGTFAWLAAGGLLCGAIFTFAIAAAQQFWTRRFGAEEGSAILISLLIPFGAYMLAEYIGASGILAAVAAGITMSYVELSGRMLATTRLERTAIWNTIQFTLNGIMFVLLGEQLPAILQGAIEATRESGHSSPWWLLLYAVALTAGLIVLRFVWVWLSLRLYVLRPKWRGSEPIARRDWRLILATSLAGVRGAITLAGVLSLPFLLPGGAQFPARDLAIFLAASVILLSLLLATLVLPSLLRGLDVPHSSVQTQQEDVARRAAARAAIDAVRRMDARLSAVARPEEQELHAAAFSQVLAIYQLRLGDSQGELDATAEKLQRADALEAQLHLAGIEAEREVILRLARQRHLPDDQARRMLRQLDLREALYSR